MWCRNCQQEVPGVSLPGEATVRCMRCHAIVFRRLDLAHRPGTPHWQGQPTVAAEVGSGESIAGGFQTDRPYDTSAHNGGLDDSTQAAGNCWRNLPGKRWLRLDPPCGPAPAISRPDSLSPSNVPEVPREKSRFLSQGLLAASLLFFTFGAGLLARSLHSGHNELARLGIVFVLGGQAGLVLGLVMHLCGESPSGEPAPRNRGRRRRQAGSPDTTEPAESFCARVAEGADPQDLLADLGQRLDHLGQQLQEPFAGNECSRQRHPE